MQVFNYSGPEFSPYDDENKFVDDSTTGPWQAPQAHKPLARTITLPGSKSLTNRELVLSALASSPSLLRSPLHSRDTALMIEALRALGVGIEELEGGGEYGPDLLITPAELEGGSSIGEALASCDAIGSGATPLTSSGLSLLQAASDRSAAAAAIKGVLFIAKTVSPTGQESSSDS